MTRSALRPDGPDIIEFAMSKRYLGKDYLSPAQQVVLKALYGMELSRDELLQYLELSEGRHPVKGGYDEAVLCCGIRSGKSDIFGGVVPTYECLRWGPVVDQYLRPGEVATYILIAENQKQAGVVRGYIEGNIQTLEAKGFKILAQTQGQARAITGRAIKLRWPVQIVIFPANKTAVRGFTGLGFVGDEIAHWECGEGAYNQDTKIMRAVRGRFATLSALRPKKILISSPDSKNGVLWEEYKARENSRAMVVRCPTAVFNPNVDREYLDREQEKDPEGYLSEYMAEFSDAGGSAFLPGESVDECVTRGVSERPVRSGVEYLGWIDAAFKRDRFSFGVGHADRRTDAVYAVIDFVRHWTPPRGKSVKALDDDKVVSEIVSVLRAYGIDRVHGDQFADVPLANKFAKLGITFVLVPASKPEKFDAYKNLRSGLKARLVELLDDPISIRDLKGLIRKERPDGYSVEAPKSRGSYDDAATVISRLVARLLPLAHAVDLSGINASAMPRYHHPDLDWRQPAPEGDFTGQMMEAVY